MRTSARILLTGGLLALATGILGGAEAAAAQSTDSNGKGNGSGTPKVSTRLGDSGTPPAEVRGRNSMLIDFDKPATAAGPVETAPPATNPSAKSPSESASKPASETSSKTEPVSAGETCSTGDGEVDRIVLEASTRFGVDPCFVVAVIDAESAGNRLAVSPKGACGYMQLMPETARRFGVTDLFDARQNIFAGTEYLRWLLDRFNGSMELALAGYNAGENAVERYGNLIPPYAETQNYVRKITGRYMTHRAGLVVAPTSVVLPPKPAPPPPPVVHNLVVEFDETPRP